MNTRVLLQQVIQQLEQAGVDAPRQDAELLLMSAWGVSQTDLIIRAHDNVPDDVMAKFEAMLTRRINREPLAYILGVKAFWKDEFVVTPDVLVPRPETEHLIEMVLKYQPNQQKNLNIADIGTGSGCISISLAKEYPNAFVTACDISDKALKIAQTNADNLGVSGRLTFLQGDLYQALSQGEAFDVIVSNPPYVSQDEMNDLEAELSFEPRFALTDEASGLTLLDKLLKDAHLHLKDGGLLVLESGLCGMPATPSTLEKLEDYTDLAGNFRGSVFCKK
ncbi:MAG TPA: peptide chain release factor N(5)-glutamine methyltransferase [Mariprofundaceae bacterium]|nr:peptide chain release factor N(5)-glutamine methyltransferase [Mariprofundaceae bacterium]